MSEPGMMRTMRYRILTVGLPLLIGGAGAAAQTTPPPPLEKPAASAGPVPETAIAPAPPVAPPKPFACERPNSPQQREAVAAAQALFDASWSPQDRTGRVTAFRTKPEAVNPFAIRDPKAEPPKPPISGYIRAQSIQCEAREADGDIGVAMFGRNVRFYEDGKWSGPIKRGLLMVISVKFVDGSAKAEAKADAPTVVLPDATLRKPEASEIPPLQAAKSKATAKKQ